MQNYIGQQIDRYRVIERLGMGGMAVVYKAYDTRLERDVAIKIIRTEAIPQEQHERLLKRFEREAKAQARFSHPNIVPVYDYGEVEDSPYLVMEYIRGGTLKERLHGPVDWRQTIGWLVPIADALGYAHEQQTIHRDVKPSNILFGENDRPLLTDFGIAKLLETDEATLTGTGLGVGTPEYMAPEQWQGKATQATDQYALGVVLYELLTGQKPYTADTPVAVALMQMSEPLRSPRTLAPSMPEALEKLLYKALARDPQDRYEDMLALRKALENVSAVEQNASIPLPSPNAQLETVAKPVFEKKPEPKPEVKPEPEPLRQPNYVHSFDSEGETRDMLDTGTGVRAVSAPKKIEKKSSQPNWVLWGGVGLVGLIGLLIGIILLIQSLTAGPARNLSSDSENLPAMEGPIFEEEATDRPMTPEPIKTDPAITELETAVGADVPDTVSYQPVGRIPSSGNEESFRAVEEKDGYLYILNTSGSMHIYDVRSLSPDDANPDYLYSTDIPNDYGLLRNGNYLYAFGWDGLTVVDVSDSADPTILRTTNDHYINNLIKHNQYLVGVGHYGVMIYSISDPSDPVLLSYYDLGYEKVLFSTAVYGETLYTSEFEYLDTGESVKTFRVIEFSDPTNLVQVNPFETDDVAYHMKVVGDRLLTCDDDYVRLWGLEDPNNPALLDESFASSRVCLLDDNGYLVTNGQVFYVENDSLILDDTFDPEDNQGSGFPFGSAKNENFVFLAQENQILILSKTANDTAEESSQEPTFSVGDFRIHLNDGAEMVMVSPDLWMYKFEVTNGMFQTFAYQEDYVTDAETGYGGFVSTGDGEASTKPGAVWYAPQGEGSNIDEKWDHPVVQVSWFDADAYCQWVGGRLPTEEEYNKAAFGGTTQNYPWGNQEPTCELGNFFECVGETTPVGSYPGGVSPLGLWDLTGNVSEWVQDGFDEDGNHETNAEKVFWRLNMGASWSGIAYPRGAAWTPPEHTQDNLGFRCVVDVDN